MEKFSEEPIVSEDWEKLVREIKSREEKEIRIIILGGVDSGKTTFRYFIEKIFQIPVLIDLDPGQQTIFLPGCVSMKFDQKILPFFIGDVKPVFHKIIFALNMFLNFIQRKKIPYDAIIVDTCGFLSINSISFKLEEIKTLSPNFVVFMKRGDEDEFFIKVLQKMSGMDFFVISSKELKSHSLEERRKIRQEKFLNYFKETKIIDLDNRRIILEGFGNLFGFFKNGFTKFLGILKEDKFLIPKIEDEDYDFAINGRIWVDESSFCF